MLSDKQFKKISIGLVSVWLFLLALLPFIFMLILSFLKSEGDQFYTFHFTLRNYTSLFNWLYVHVFFRSVFLAGATTIICLLIAYPFAYILARVAKPNRMILLLLVVVPFWTSSLIRTYAIVAIIQANGLLNKLLLSLHLIHHPLQILYTPLASMIGLVYSLLPYMVLPIYANLEKFDWRLLEAAQDLGASKWVTYRRVLFPLSVPGILSGVMLVFLPAMTIFYIPDILGGAKSILLGNLIKDQFLEIHNWPMGAVTSVMLTLMMIILLLIYTRFSTAKQRSSLL